MPEFPVETMDLQQLGAQTSRVEPLVVKEPVLEVCDLDFPEKSEDVEFAKCRLGDLLFLFQMVYRHYPTFLNCLGTFSVVFSIRPRALFLQVEEEDEELKPQTPIKGAGVRSGKLGVTVMKERWEPEPFWKVFVKGPLDGYMGIVVLINLAFMILDTQSTGATADFALGLSEDAGWNIDENFFQVAEYIFFSM